MGISTINWESKRGFVTPAVIFALLLLSVLAIAGLAGSVDEFHSSEAMLKSSVAFYAAEAGVHDLWGNWGQTEDSLIGTLNPGDTVDFSWQTLSGGSSYHAMVVRTDGGSTPGAYHLFVEGRGAGAKAGSRMLILALTGSPGGGGGPYTLGKCCDAAAKTRGTVKVNTALLSGEDSIPAGWNPARCSAYTPDDVAGLVALDAADVSTRSSTTLLGDPAFYEDMTLTDTDFTQFGDLSLDELAAMATTHLYNWNGSSKGLDWGGDPAPAGCRDFPVTSGGSSGCLIGPRYNVDGSCDTGHPLNFGAPTGACKDHFPIVRISGNWAFDGDGAAGGYAQGIFVMDTSTAADFGTKITQTGVGSEFDIEGNNPFEVVGIIVGRGCFEMDSPAYGTHAFYGGILSDGSILPHPSCGTDPPYYQHSDTDVQYSQCVVQKALDKSGVGAAAGGGGAGLTTISSRALREILQ